jgi:hypothetical protein
MLAVRIYWHIRSHVRVEWERIALGKFATNTDVSAEKSRAEIESILKRYGATSFAYAPSPQALRHALTSGTESLTGLIRPADTEANTAACAICTSVGNLLETPMTLNEAAADRKKLDALIDWYEQFKPESGKEITLQCNPKELAMMFDQKEGRVWKSLPELEHRGRKIIAGKPF